jgi:translation elongation factor P/translation initiation factor 5A
VVDVVKVSATVQKVDLEKRKATLLMSDGKSTTVKVDKSVQNLDQVQPGDHVKIIYTEETVVVIGKTGEQVGASGGGVVSVAAKGAKPGSYSLETESMTGKVLAVDVPKHKVTLEDADGKKKTFKVSKKIQNLDQLKVGDNIDISITEALAIEVSK